MNAKDLFDVNVKDNNLLGEFLTNYRIPHQDRNGSPLKVGDEVLCEWEDSWIHGRRGFVLKLGVLSRAGECEGHLLQMDCGTTVAPVEGVRLIPSKQSEPLIQTGDFTLNSGAKSDWKLVCDDFIRDNLAGLVCLARKIIGPFSSVEGVPRGGLLLADALKPFCDYNGAVHLIIEDVVTTGGSMEKIRQKELANPYWTQNGAAILGLTVFARGPCPVWVKPLFTLPQELWIPRR